MTAGEWSAARPGRTLPPVKAWYPLYRRLGGPQGRSGRAENLVPTGIRSRTVRLVVQSLYRLSYPPHNVYIRIVYKPNVVSWMSVRTWHTLYSQWSDLVNVMIVLKWIYHISSDGKMITRVDAGMTYKKNIKLEYYSSTDLQITNKLRRKFRYNSQLQAKNRKCNFLNRKHEWT